MKILGIGLTGLIGSRIVELLKDRYEFENLSRNTGLDITDLTSVTKAITNSDASVVFQAAAHTDVKAAEKEKELGEKSLSWRINVEGTNNIVKACEQTGKKVIHISTDLVLGGDTAPEGGFTEDAELDPLSWYAVTKAEGEKVVRSSSGKWIIMRLAYPYRSYFVKPDFVRFFINGLREGKHFNVLTDRIFSPTFIDDLALAFDSLVSQDATGIYHTAGGRAISLYDSVIAIAKTFDLDESLIGKTTRAEFLVGRPPEPFHSELNNDKIRKLGVKMRSFEEGLVEVKKQMLIMKSDY